MKKQVIFLSKRQVAEGVNNEGQWILWGYKNEEGIEYTTFNGKHALDEPREIEYTEKETKGRDGRIFINRRLVEPKEYTPAKKENPAISITEVALTIGRLEAKIDELFDRVADVQRSLDNKL